MNTKPTQLTVLLITVLTLVAAGAVLTFAPLSAAGNQPQRIVSVAMATLPPPYITFPTDTAPAGSAERGTTVAESAEAAQPGADELPAPSGTPPTPLEDGTDGDEVNPSTPTPVAQNEAVVAVSQPAQHAQPTAPPIVAPTTAAVTTSPTEASAEISSGQVALAPASGTVHQTQPASNPPTAFTAANDDFDQGPFGGVPWPIPGALEAENYDTGGEGVAYRDKEPENIGGFYRPDEGVDIRNNPLAISWTAPQEWVEYTVEVAETARYQLAIRYQTDLGDQPQIALYLSGRAITGPIVLPTTMPNEWATHFVAKVPLLKGERILRIALDSGLSLDSVTFELLESTATPTPTGTPIPPTVTPTSTSIPPTGTPTPTNTPVPPTPTSTPVPPTPTPSPTSTPIPPTPTPTPDPGDRLCDPSLHSTVVLHGHYNAEHDCYYDHSHVAPGEWPSDLFVTYTGQTLSYPWLTMGGMENLPWPMGKHEAYNFHSGQVDGTWNSENAASADMRFEVEWHGMSNNMGMRTRFHSFAALLHIPHDTAGDGYIFWGGWMDCGQRVTIDGNDNWYTVDDGRPQPGGTALKHVQSWNNSQTWYCQLPDLPMENTIGQQYGFQIGPTTPDNLFDPLDAFCGPDAGPECTSRGQSQEIALLLFDISSPWTDFLDPDGNGWIEHYEAWTDRYGTIQPDGVCAERGLDCVPLVIHNVERLRYRAQGNVFHRTVTDAPRYLDWWNRTE